LEAKSVPTGLTVDLAQEKVKVQGLEKELVEVKKNL